MTTETQMTPTYTKNGLALRDTLSAIAGPAALPFMRLQFQTSGGAMDTWVRLPGFNVWTGDGRDSIEDALLAPMPVSLDVRTFAAPGQGSKTQVAAIPISVECPVLDAPALALSSQTNYSGARMPSPWKYLNVPARESAKSRLSDYGCSLVIDAGDKLVGLILLTEPIAEQHARVIASTLSLNIPGASPVAVQREIVGNDIRSGVAHLFMATPPPMLVPVPLARPSANLVPRFETWAYGGCERIDPKTLTE